MKRSYQEGQIPLVCCIHPRKTAKQKHYISFYLLNREIVEKNRRLLAGLNVGKGCIRFKDIRVLPEPTIRAMLREAAIANEAQPNDHC